MKLLLNSLDAMGATLVDRVSVNTDSGIADFIFCCSALYLKRVWQEKPRISTATALADSPFILELGAFLGAFHRDILLPYGCHLDEERFIRLYGTFVNERSLPHRFFNSDHNFEKWAEKWKTLDFPGRSSEEIFIETQPYKLDEDEEEPGPQDLPVSVTDTKSVASFQLERFSIDVDTMV